MDADRPCAFGKQVAVAVPLGIYSITSSMFYPVFQSLVFEKVCIVEAESHPNMSINCTSGMRSSRNTSIQTEANRVLLICSIVMCLLGAVSSAFVGRIGDLKSRKYALLIPFVGLILSDVTYIVQSYFMDLSVYWLVLSEALFASFGGYMSIFSACFAYACDSSVVSCERRSHAVAVLEGSIGLGGTVGFLITFLLHIVGYNWVYSAFLVTHIVCLILIFFLPAFHHTPKERSGQPKLSLFQHLMVPFVEGLSSTLVLILILSFAISFFVFIGVTHILFYYLKYQFQWDAGMYGFLKGPVQGLSTLATLLLYPFLRRKGIHDCYLALSGLISRSLGAFWIAIAWSSGSVFILILFDAFSRFAPTGLRALLANTVPVSVHGSMFALLAVTEALCNLAAASVFHNIFPLTLNFLPQLSFIVMGAIMIIPCVLIWVVRKMFTISVDGDQHPQDSSAEIVASSSSNMNE
ncbi:hypothetical protein AB6A40_002667 [Gnathostoma spinigerum]|uniref:Major facilitator superfamily (MFS) profile domain-containing protein n=1 Tax=Gnathostoma spinigerum TaxID=75299 RepID=A0ABD6EGA4_9BILA